MTFVRLRHSRHFDISDLREAVLCDGAGRSGEAEGVVGRGRAVHQQKLARLHQKEITAQLPASRRYPAEKLRPHTGEGVEPVIINNKPNVSINSLI